MRTTIYLDEGLLTRLRQLVPPRGLNRFISQAVEEKVEALERQRIEEMMKEGYLATREDREDLNQDWAVVDTESWPE
jgi:hypothetical protein